jgi:hypothetical protein
MAVSFASAQTSPPTSANSTVRPVGTIKAITGNAITLATDAGPELNISVQDSARIVRTAPGEKDLKAAVPIKLGDLQVGDRVLVRGQMSDDGKSVLASSVIAIKKDDIAERQKRDLQDWQRRGSGGLVKSVDASTGTITISTSAAGVTKSLAVHTSKDTIVRRYAPDSVKFDDAKLSKLDEIKVGDQLRARGTKTANGTELAADEIVSGSFRNIAGTISSIDSAKNTITVMDLATKKPVTVRIAPESQVRKLPAMVAMGLAARLKGISTAGSGQPTDGAAARPAGDTPRQGERPAGDAGARPSGEGGGTRAGGPGGFGGSGQRPNGGGDIQQMLSRMPAMPFTDFQKGDAVMVVTTQDATAITLLSGVEPILTASPNGAGAASLLSPWNLGAAPGDATALP